MFSSHFIAPVAVVTLIAGLTACSTPPTRQQMGTGTGAVLGGVVGNVITDGSTLGTIGGAAAGGLIGNEVTKPK